MLSKKVKEKSKIDHVLRKMVVWGLAGITFLTPIFFLPFTPQQHELNKSIFFLVFVFIVLVVWIFKAVYNKKLVILHSKLNYLLLGLFGLYFLSSLLSVNIINSFLGSFNQGSLSLINFSAYLIYFFLILNNIRTLRQFKILFFSLFSSFTAALLFSFFNLSNIFLLGFIQAAKKPSFNLVSSSLSGLLAFYALLLPLLIIIALKKGQGLLGRILQFFAVMLVLLSLVVFNTINFSLIWYSLSLGTAVILIVVFSGILKKYIDKKFLFLPILVFIFAVASLALAIKPFIKQRQLPAEVSLGRRISFEIARKSLKSKVSYFFIGSGPETFLYDFASRKPQSFNKNFLWNIRFDKANDLYAELLSSLGVLGILLFISFFIFILGDALFLLTNSSEGPKKDQGVRDLNRLKKLGSEIIRLDFGNFYKAKPQTGARRQEKGEKEFVLYGTALFSAWVAFLVVHFFFPGRIAVFVAGWAIAGLICALNYIYYPKTYKEIKISFKASARHSLLFSFLFVLSLSAVVFFFTFTFKLYLANLKYIQAEQTFAEAQRLQDQGDPSKVRDLLNQAMHKQEEAITLNGLRPEYYLKLAKIYLAQANLEALKGDQADRTLLQKFLKDALADAKKGTDMAVRNVNLWESRGQIYQNIALFSKDANQWIIKSYEKVVELEPINPVAYTEIGKAYLAQAGLAQDDTEQETDYNKAVDNFQRALELKDNYFDARYNLALTYEKKKMLNEALAEIRKAEKLVPNNLNVKYEAGRLYFNRSLTKGLDTNEGKEDLNKAKLRFETVLKENQNYANALYSLALVYEKENNLSKAIEYMEKVQKLNPDKEEVKKKLESLRQKQSGG